jgi:hypothetical protein
MPAPTNTSFTTATSLGTLPASVSQNVHDSGTTYEVFYKFTAPTGKNGVGIFGFGDLSIYRPTVRVYTGPASSPTQYLSLTTSQNKPIQIPVTAGTEYFLKFTPNAGNPTPAVLLIEAETAPTSAATRGGILINDDTAGYPAVVIEPGTGTVLRFVHPFPSGEAGDTLDNGVILFEDADTNELKAYDRNFATLATHSFAGGDPRIRANRDQQVFYIGRSSNPVIFRKVDAAGALDPTTSTLTGHTSLLAFAVSNDGTKAYHAPNSAGAALKQWDITGSTNLADLRAGTAGYSWVDALVLEDDTIVALHANSANGQTNIYRLDPAGTLLNTYAKGADALPGGTFPRLSYAIRPDRFRVMLHPTTSTASIQEIDAATGTVVDTTPITVYEFGIYSGAETASPTTRFGVSVSCPLVTIRLLEPIIDPSLPGGCCESCGCSRCCGATRTLSAGRTGRLNAGIEDSAATLIPSSSNGRLLPATADPTYPETWA